MNHLFDVNARTAVTLFLTTFVVVAVISCVWFVQHVEDVKSNCTVNEGAVSSVYAACNDTETTLLNHTKPSERLKKYLDRYRAVTV